LRDSRSDSFYRKLKPGPSQRTDEVSRSQRARLQRAMVQLTAERGFERVTVRDLARTAGVSSRSFYGHFTNTEDCFAETHEAVVRRLERRIGTARCVGVGWEANMRAGLAAALGELAARPNSANLILVEAYAAGPGMAERIAAATARIARVRFDGLEGAAEAPSPASARLATAVVAGVAHVARTSLLTGRTAELPNLAGPLGDWIAAVRGGCRDFAPLPRERDRRAPGARRHRNGRNVPMLGELGDEHGRLLTSAARLGVNGGFSSLSVPTIRNEAGVSRRAFHTRFTGADDCFLEAIEALMRTVSGRAARRARAATDFEQAVHLAAAALCADLARNPALARLGFVEILAPGRDGLHRREHLISHAARVLRDLAPLHSAASEPLAEARIAAGWHLIASEVAAGRTEDLPRLVTLLTRLLSTPGAHPRTSATPRQPEIENIALKNLNTQI
jgi:AcrR family transcriptional regulator